MSPSDEASSNGAYAQPPRFDVQAHIGDAVLGDAEINQLEVVRARLALELICQRLGNDRMRELLVPETRAAAERMRAWLQASGGAWTPAITEITVPGIGAQAFVEWWTGRPKSGDEVAMRIAHPEHYVVHPQPDHSVEVIETVGQDDGPWRIFLNFLDDPSQVPLPPSPGYPIRIGALIVDDAGMTVAHVMHEFRDTDDGFRARLTLNFPSAVPDHVVRGHQQHFSIEFRNWGRNAAQAQSRTG